MSSAEVTAWQAYEVATGPLDHLWRDETLAAIHEQLQITNHLLGAAHFTDKKHRKNPIAEPAPLTRPHEIFEKMAEEEGR